MQSFHEINNVLDNCCKIALKQPVKDKQMVLMTDASFTAAGYALMTEDDPEQKVKSKRKLTHQLLLVPRRLILLKLNCQSTQKIS